MDAQLLWASHTNAEGSLWDCSGITCDICETEWSADQELWMVDYEYHLHVCGGCTKTFHAEMTPAAGHHVGRCIRCDQPSRQGYEYVKDGAPLELIFLCSICYPTFSPPSFAASWPSGAGPRWLLSVRRLLAEAYSVPPGAADAVTPEGNRQYISLLSGCKVPPPGNVLEWTLLGNIDSTDDNGFVVNCVRPEHPVCSITVDSRGWSTVDPIPMFDSFEQYQAWRDDYELVKAGE